jgi:HPt (histidine-containing phosphotransfer) domain-containing protein
MDLSKQRHFNPAALMLAVGDDPQIYLEMCHLFLRTVPELKSMLCAAASRRDTETIRKQAHSLRGSCMLVGAKELSQLLHAAEQAGIAGNAAEAVGRVEQVAIGLDCLLEEIQQALTASRLSAA